MSKYDKLINEGINKGTTYSRYFKGSHGGQTPQQYKSKQFGGFYKHDPDEPVLPNRFNPSLSTGAKKKK